MYIIYCLLHVVYFQFINFPHCYCHCCIMLSLLYVTLFLVVFVVSLYVCLSVCLLCCYLLLYVMSTSFVMLQSLLYYLSPIHLYFTCNFYNFILFQLGALVVAHWASGLSSIIMIPYHTIPFLVLIKLRTCRKVLI